MATDTTTTKLKTRTAQGEAQHETLLTINWDDAKAERAFAERGVRVAAAAIWRAAGDIPATFSVNVSELAKRERGGFAMKPSAANAQRMMSKLSNDEYAVALASIGIDKRNIERMVKARVAPTPAPKKSK
jgi:hypothetical protein